MHADITKIIEDIRASYWFIPSVMCVVAFALSAGMMWLDGRYGASWIRDYDFLTATRTDGARAVLSTIAGSIIGVAGVTFSITIVAVSFASANFGPRLISNFMRDTGNQITLGTFIGTFVYCVMILRTVRNASAEASGNDFSAFVPHLSILMAIILAMACVGVLIYFIHHVPETINVGNLTAKVGRQLRCDIDDLFPDPDALQPDQDLRDQNWDDLTSRLTHTPIKARQAGFIQALDQGHLASLAEEHDVLIRVQYSPGDFVAEQSIVFDIWSKGDPSETLPADLVSAFALGNERTAHQNVLFLADQLVEIIGRALSPGVNDPFTAITCFNWLKVGLARFMEKGNLSAMPTADDRVRLYPITLERLSAVVFDQTLQYVSADRNVTLHVIALLTELAATAKDQDQRALLLSHMSRLVAASTEKLTSEIERVDIKERHEKARQILSEPDADQEYRSNQHWFGGRA